MSLRCVGWAIPDAGDDDERGADLTIRVDDRGYCDGPVIVVRWPCGDTREFRPADAASTIANLELLAPHPVWMETEDMNGNTFGARLLDEHLRAGDHAADTEWTESRAYPWKLIKKAVKKALATADDGC